MLTSMNDPMRALWVQAESLFGATALHVDLLGLLCEGLTAVDGGLFFTRELRANLRLRNGRADLTGQEAVINKIHLDDLVDTGSSGWPLTCLVQGVLLAGGVLDAAAAMSSLPVDVVISVDFGGPIDVGGEGVDTYPSATFRFLGRREGQAWVSPDLGAYTEPVAVLQREVC